MNDGKVMFRVNNDLKRQFETVVNGLGMNQTTAFTVFMMAVVRCGGIPFDVRDTSLLTGRNIATSGEDIQPVRDDIEM